MSKKNRRSQKHLTLSDRIYIEQELLQGSTFRSIGEGLDKDPTTISKEVRSRSSETQQHIYFKRCHTCMAYKYCKLRHVCGDLKCGRVCRYCYHVAANEYCTEYRPFHCDVPEKPPYVCNACDIQTHCPRVQRLYSAEQAQRMYEKTLKSCRTGVNLSAQEIVELNNLITPLVKKGQPLSHIFAMHGSEIPCSRRTLYNYFDMGLFDAINLDLPRRVRYKKRRKTHKKATGINKQAYRNKRTYKDFENFMDKHPDLEVVELDTVKGSRTSGKCLMTLLFRKSNFMIAILLPRCTQESVIKAFNSLTETLTLRLFRKTFPVILTDNGSEFKDSKGIENTPDGKHRTYVFYCDPYTSRQKGKIEKNHEYIRYISPKGRSMQKLTQEDVTRMMCHINSTARDGLNGRTPFDAADLFMDKRVPVLLSLFRVSPDKVLLKPELINHRSTKADLE